LLYFFFSSRRRHTRSKRDWSSDVCSSDLLCKSRRAAGRELGRIRPTRAYYQARKSNAQSQVLPWILHQLESELPSNSLIMSDKRKFSQSPWYVLTSGIPLRRYGPSSKAGHFCQKTSDCARSCSGCYRRESEPSPPNDLRLDPDPAEFP